MAVKRAGLFCVGGVCRFASFKWFNLKFHSKFLIYALFIPIIISDFLSSCDHIENPYPAVSTDLDTSLYPGLWSDYVSTSGQILHKIKI